MSVPDPKRISMPRNRGLRIEAGGCVIYIDHHAGGGTMVEIIPDGDRFAGRNMLARTIVLRGGKMVRRVEGSPASHSIRVAVEDSRERRHPSGQ